MADILSGLCLQQGKRYSIEDVINALEGFEEVKIGHAVVPAATVWGASIHQYYLGKSDLENILILIPKKEKELGERLSRDITILSVIDPMEKYERFTRFYKNIERDILNGIEKSKKGAVATPRSVLLEEGKKSGFDLENRKILKEFLDGMRLFFARLGVAIESGADYVIFKNKECPR